MSFGCVTCSAVLLKPNVANILFHFCEQKFVQHAPITIAIDCNGHSLHISEEKWPNYESGPKSAPNSESFWVRRLFNVCVLTFCTENTTILLVYIPIKIKMSFIWRADFFFAKICTFCKSIAGPLSENAYTQAYSFSGRIKLITCQIRHKLSVTIHEISNSWKNKC